MFCRNERHVSIEGTSRMPCSVPKGPLVVVGQCCISCPHVELHLAKTSSSVPFRPQVRQVKGPVIMFDHTFDVWLSKRYQQDFAHIDEGAAGTNSCLEVSLRWTTKTLAKTVHVQGTKRPAKIKMRWLEPRYRHVFETQTNEESYLLHPFLVCTHCQERRSSEQALSTVELCREG